MFSDFKELIFVLVEHADTLPQLNPVQSKKLKHLTIVSLAAKCKVSACILIEAMEPECDISLYFTPIYTAVNIILHIASRVRH